MSGDHDEKVYLAKLAEQAERYDGNPLSIFSLFFSEQFFFVDDMNASCVCI